MPSAIVKSKVASLKVETSTSLVSISTKQWKHLFADHPDPPELIKLVDLSGMDGFEFRSIIVKADGEPILVLPIMLSRYPVTTTLDGKVKEAALWLEVRLPNVLSPKILVVGFVEGEWGQIGIDPNLSPELLNRSWDLALRTLKRIAKEEKTDGIALWQFTQKNLQKLPKQLISDCAVIAGQPFSELPVNFSCLDDYFATVDSDMRRYLKRALKQRDRVRIERTKDIGNRSQEIYRLYRQQVKGSLMSFGEQSHEYFASATLHVPGAEYILYFSGESDQLLGFELVVIQEDRLVSKYFAMEAQLGREYKLYFLSWLENIKYCIDKNIPLFHVGASGEELKTKLGARLVPTAVLVRHGNLVVNLILRQLEETLSYQSAIELPLVTLPT